MANGAHGIGTSFKDTCIEACLMVCYPSTILKGDCVRCEAIFGGSGFSALAWQESEHDCRDCQESGCWEPFDSSTALLRRLCLPKCSEYCKPMSTGQKVLAVSARHDSRHHSDASCAAMTLLQVSQAWKAM